jgi:CheY-like chemotaxis protein
MRVLVVEDDASMSASLVKGLTAEDYIVDTAADGEQGTWLALEGTTTPSCSTSCCPAGRFAVVAELRRRVRHAGADAHGQDG